MARSAHQYAPAAINTAEDTVFQAGLDAATREQFGGMVKHLVDLAKSRTPGR